MRTAQRAIADFLTELHERGYAFGTRRLRGNYSTEYLEHALNTEGTPHDLAAADLMDLERADAWLEAAAAGDLRQRNTLHGPNAESSDAAQRSRIITYNVFAAYLGTPWRLEVPPNAGGEHLDPEEAAEIARKLSVQRHGRLRAHVDPHRGARLPGRRDRAHRPRARRARRQQPSAQADPGAPGPGGRAGGAR
ncbi:hypothetical protein ACWD4F_23140 [Streptomyces aureus]